MKKIFFQAAAAMLTLSALVACNTEPEALVLQKPKKFDHATYNANLRDFKSTFKERSICFVWFSEYNANDSSMAFRFAGLPDSVDICSLWGGYPDPVMNPTAYKEMWEMRREKGTLLVAPTIIRIMENANYENFGLTYEDMVSQKTTIDPTGKYPDWCVLYGNHLLQDMWDNGIDGLDLDYEPESGDEQRYGIYGPRLTLFVEYLGQFIGPQGEDPSKLLIIDYYGATPPAETEPYVDYYVKQNYGSRTCSYPSQFPTNKMVFTENIGDYWQNGGYILNMAENQPANGYKGGFGAFFCNRDYYTTEDGSSNTIPYERIRRGIQIQNPAVIK